MTVEGTDTRPMTDRVKESLFSILHARGCLDGARVLDLFAGSGGLGIEALSRGAAEAVFIERDDGCIAAIGTNLKRTRLAEAAQIIAADVADGLQLRLAPGRLFDLIFFDPPFALTRGGLDPATPAVCLAAERLAPEGQLFVRHEHDQEQPERLVGLQRTEVRRWGRNAVSFYARPESQEPKPPTC